MCVIMVSEDTRSTAEMVRAGWEANKHGAGFAYRGEGKVHWVKDASLDQMIAAAAELPMPYVLHFRIPSCGGAEKELCHPFVVDKSATCHIMKGSTAGNVLFHNGHYHAWQTELKDICGRFRVKLPRGHWSDTRAMAWMAYMYGEAILDVLGEKLVLFGPKTLNVYGREGDHDWHMHNGVIVSNSIWKPREPYRGTSSYHTTPPASIMGPSPSANGTGRPSTAVPFSTGQESGRTTDGCISTPRTGMPQPNLLLPPAPIDLKAIRKLRKHEAKELRRLERRQEKIGVVARAIALMSRKESDPPSETPPPDPTLPVVTIIH